MKLPRPVSGPLLRICVLAQPQSCHQTAQLRNSTRLSFKSFRLFAPIIALPVDNMLSSLSFTLLQS